MDALKALRGDVEVEEPPIDPGLMAKIQGAVFKTLRPRSIQMHLEARRLYRIRKRKEEKEGLTLVVKETNHDVGRGHQLWLEALDLLENKPVVAPIEQVRVEPVVRCHCWEGSNYCKAILGDDE